MTEPSHRPNVITRIYLPSAGNFGLQNGTDYAQTEIGCKQASPKGNPFGAEEIREDRARAVKKVGFSMQRAFRFYEHLISWGK